MTLCCLWWQCGEVPWPMRVWWIKIKKMDKSTGFLHGKKTSQLWQLHQAICWLLALVSGTWSACVCFCAVGFDAGFVVLFQFTVLPLLWQLAMGSSRCLPMFLVSQVSILFVLGGWGGGGGETHTHRVQDVSILCERERELKLKNLNTQERERELKVENFNTQG